MTISTTCPHCNHSLQAPDSYAGQTGPCPQCRTLLRLPAPHSPPYNQTIAPPLSPPSSSPTPSPLTNSLANSTTEPSKLHTLESLRRNRRLDPLFSPQIDLLQRAELLGKGGMGSVYRIHDPRFDRDAALKILTIDPDSDLSAATERFLREARLMARLEHPSIPPVYETGTTAKGEHFLLMRIIHGKTLADLIKSHFMDKPNPEPSRLLLEALIKVCEALAFAHSKGIIHRDLKPANIMVGEYGEVMLMDWGIARDLNEDDDLPADTCPSILSTSDAKTAGLTLAGSVLGTPGYMSPEQASGERVDERTDVFALGAILCEILTGSPPVSGSSPLLKITNTIRGQIQRPRDIRPDVPPELNSIANRALAFAPDKRLANTTTFLSCLRARLSGEAVSVHNYSKLERLSRSARKHSAFLLSSTLLSTLLALSAGLWTALEQTQHAAIQSAERQRHLDEQLAASQRSEEIAKRESARIKMIIAQLNQARDLARRGAPETPIKSLVEDTLRETERSYDALLTASSIYDEAQMGSEQTSLLNEAATNFPPAYQALFALHTIALEKSKRSDFYVTAPLARLLQLSKERGDENEFTLFAEAVHSENDGDSRKAIELFSRSLQQSPRWSWPLVTRGYSLYRIGDLNAAIHDFNAALEINPRLAAAYLNRATCLQALGDKLGALNDLDKAIALQPRWSNALSNRANIHSSLGNSAAALEDFKNAIEFDPQNTFAYTNRGKLHRILGDQPSAMQDFNKAVQLAPANPTVYQDRGAQLHFLHDWQAALQDYNKALELNPNFAEALYDRARLFQDMNEPGRALEDYNKAIELNPRYALAFNNRSLILDARGQPKAALRDLDKAIELDPRLAIAWNNRGRIRSQGSDHKGALEDYNTAIELNPTYATAWLNRGNLRFATGDKPGAMHDYNKAIELKPDYPLAYNNRAILRAELGDKDGALVDYNRATQATQPYLEAYVNRAEFYIQQKLWQKALQDLELFLDLAPQHPGLPQVRKMISHAQQELRNNP